MKGITDEHEYIEALISERYWSDVERLVYPLNDQARQHLVDSNQDAAINLEAQADQIQQALMNERNNSFDRLHWLKLDTELRLEGKTYPDVYESCNFQQGVEICLKF